MEAQNVSATLTQVKDLIRENPSIAEAVTDKLIDALVSRVPLPGFIRNRMRSILDALLPDLFIDSLHDVVMDALDGAAILKSAKPEGES